MIRSSMNSISSLGYDLTLVETLFRLGARPPVVCAVCQVGKKNGHTNLQDPPPTITQARYAAL